MTATVSMLDCVPSNQIPVLLQVGKIKYRKLGGVVDSDACLDLLIADVPDNLPVPRISNPSSTVPPWNVADVDDFVETLFAFAVQHLSDDGAILLFLPGSPSIRKDVLGWAEAYGYMQYKDWWGINELRFSSYRDPQRTVLTSFLVAKFLFFLSLTYVSFPCVSPFCAFQFNFDVPLLGCLCSLGGFGFCSL